MAFRRFRPRKFKRPFRRRFSGRSRGPRFARQKFDRIVLYNNLNAGPVAGPDTGSLVGNANGICGPVQISACSPRDSPPFCGPLTDCGQALDDPSPRTCSCCVTEAQFNLVSNDTLESFYQDSVTVVRIYGDIYYRALVAFPSFNERCSLSGSVLASINEIYAQTYQEQWHWSMRKHLRTQAAIETSPLEAAGPIYNYDWTESSPPWLWQRIKVWQPRNSRQNWEMASDSPLGICSNTSQASYVVPAEASGAQPSYTVPAESTTCQLLTPAGSESCGQRFDSFITQEPPWHHLRVSFRKHVRMVRDQDLNITCHVRHPDISGLGGYNCIPAATIPSFARAFTVNYMFYVRLAAVVRLN